MVDIKIVAVKERQEMAESLRDGLGLSDEDIIYDERPDGGNPYVPTKEAWLKPVEEGVTHRLVLNEDVQVCSNFRHIIEQMAQSHPDCAFSLFTMNFDGEDFDSFFENLTTPYIKHDWSMWGCAILMPLNVVEECFQYIDTFFDENVHESHGIHCFLKQKGIPILSTLPVTVQHIGDDSLYDPNLPVRRTTRFDANPTADWTSSGVATPPGLEWFKPKQIAGAPDRLDSLLKILRGVKDDE